MRHNTKLTLASAISLAMLSACGGGGGSSTPANNAPSASVKASGTTLTTSTQQDLVANFGDDITLDASTSTDPDKDSISFEWKILAKPENSKLKLNTGSSKTAILKYKVDALGEYKLALTVSDAKGAKTEKTITILANNTAPTLNTVENIVFQPELTQKEAKDISVGSSILFDASQSSDADGNAISFVWELSSKPASSNSALQVNNKKASLSVDALGVYKVKVTGTDSKGASSAVIYTYTVNNRAPTTILLGNATPVVNDTGEKTLDASVGYNILLDGSGSKDEDKNPLTYTWTLLGKPAKSTVSLADNTQSKLSIVPDVEGTYKVQLKVTDPAGASSISTTVITVNNTRPTASIGSNVAPVASPTGPTVTIPLLTPVTVYGSNSTDANGDALTYVWSIVSIPKDSKLTISNPHAANLTFKGDVSGSYILRLKVTDTHNTSSEQDITINIGNNAPVAVIDKTFINTDVQSTITVSAAGSFDDDGDNLTYQWKLDSAPAKSTANLNNQTSGTLNFTPDIAGLYSISLTVSDGKNTNTSLFSVQALDNVAQSVQLNFVPSLSVYSRGLDKLLSVDERLNQLKIIDPFKKTIKTVQLPGEIISVQLSPDGKLAAALLDGQIHLVNVATAKVLQVRSTDGQHTDAFVTNSGVAYAIGQTGGQWVNPPVTRVDLNSGIISGFNYGFLYGTQKGIYANKLNKVFLHEFGISPSDIDYFTLDPKSTDVISAGDSPYHGDYDVGSKLWLNSNQDLVFTDAGTYFYANSLKYAGQLSDKKGKIRNISSISSNSKDTELLVTSAVYKDDEWDGSMSLPISYTLLSDFKFNTKQTLKFPQVNGLPSYGLDIFHSATDHHVAIVQTGSDNRNDDKATYHVIVR